MVLTWRMQPPLPPTAVHLKGISGDPRFLQQQLLSLPVSLWRLIIVLICAFSLFIVPSLGSHSQFISYQEHALWAEKQFPLLLLLQEPKRGLIYAISFRFKNLQLHLGTFPGDRQCLV